MMLETETSRLQCAVMIYTVQEFGLVVISFSVFNLLMHHYHAIVYHYQAPHFVDKLDSMTIF